MMRTLKRTVWIVGLTALAPIAFADPLAVGADDTTATVLTTHAGKRVTLKLRSGEELSGTVGTVNESVVHLRELVGREFFDAAVAMKAVDAVIVRTRDR